MLRQRQRNSVAEEVKSWDRVVASGCRRWLAGLGLEEDVDVVVRRLVRDRSLEWAETRGREVALHQMHSQLRLSMNRREESLRQDELEKSADPTGRDRRSKPELTGRVLEKEVWVLRDDRWKS